MRNYVAVVLGLLLVIGFVSTAGATTDWKSLKTENFTVFYKPGYEWEAKQTLANLEYYQADVVKLTGNKKIGHIPIVVYDAGTFPNGFCNPMFKNIGIFTYTPRLGGENWYRDVGVHEYIHMGHLTKTGGAPGVLTTIFGTLWQPNLFSPGWVAEGIATYGESQASPYEGRLNDGFFDAYINCRSAEGKFPSINTATHLSFDEYPGGGSSYLYGGTFFKYLSSKYGEDKFAKFFELEGSSLLSYLGPMFPSLGIDRSAKKTYGKSLSQLFREWQEYTQSKTKDWHIEGERLTHYGWDLSYLTIYGRKLYYVREYPKKTGAFKGFMFSEVVERDLDTQKEKVVVSFTSTFNASLRVEDGKLYYLVWELKKGYKSSPFDHFGFISSLHEKDLVTCEDRILLKDEIRAFCPLGDGKIIYSIDKEHGFGSELWVYSEDGKKLLFESGYLIGEILSTSAGIFVSARKDWENLSIYLLDLDKKAFSSVIHTPWSETSLSEADGLLLFTANYGGVYSIYGYDPKIEKLYRLTRNGYANSPVMDKKENILYFAGLSSDGFDLFKKRIDSLSEFTPIVYKESPKPDLSFKTEVKEGGYLDNLKTLSPKIHTLYSFPGAYFAGGDAVGENSYALDLSYDSDKKKTKGKIYLGSTFFAPSTLGFEYVFEDSIGLTWSYPLVQRLAPGLAQLSVSLGGKAYGGADYPRKQLTPGLSCYFNYPGFVAGVGVDCLLEQKNLGGDLDRTGWETTAMISKYIHNSQLDILGRGIYDPDNPDPEKITIRGYKESLEANIGGALTIEHSLPLFKIRKGLWNPNIFFNDMGLVGFTDAAFSKNRTTQASIGVELQQEISLSYLEKLGLVNLGFAVNKDKQSTTYFNIRLF